MFKQRHQFEMLLTESELLIIICSLVSVKQYHTYDLKSLHHWNDNFSFCILINLNDHWSFGDRYNEQEWCYVLYSDKIIQITVPDWEPDPKNFHRCVHIAYCISCYVQCAMYALCVLILMNSKSSLNLQWQTIMPWICVVK